MIVVANDASAQILERVKVDKYELRWNDAGSGHENDMALWHPTPPSGYFVFGSIGLDSNKKQPGRDVVTYAYKPMKKISANNKEYDAIVYPTDYKLIWKDKGSGAKMDGSVWEPIPPKDYIALGHVAVTGHKKPSVKDSACILNTDVLLEQRPFPNFRYSWFSNGVAKANYKPFDLRTFRVGPDRACIATFPSQVSSHHMNALGSTGNNNTLEIPKDAKYGDLKDAAFKK